MLDSFTFWINRDILSLIESVLTSFMLPKPIPKSIPPSKGLGQHFLIDKGVLAKIVAAADLQPDDNVLEIGPGLGVLTLELAKRAKKVVAVEKDPRLIPILKENLTNHKNVEIVQKDVLKIGNWNLIENWKLEIGNYKVVANLPYYIASPTIRMFLEMEEQPKLMVLMVQKEVAKRITAKPPKMSILAVSVQFYAEAKIISYVSKKSFRPRPKVDSAIIKIIPKAQSIQTPDVCMFFNIVKTGFAQPRKQLVNNLSTGLSIGKEQIKKWLLKNNIKPTQRAETLTMENWLNLTKSFKIE